MLLLALLSAFAGTAPLALVDPEAADQPSWSRFRGPNGSGVADVTGLPTALDPETTSGWRRPLPGGHSSPALHAERIFLTALEGERLFTLCLDADDGVVRWRREVPRTHEEALDGRNHPAAPSAAVDADVVVAFFSEHGLVAYDHDGDELWQIPLGPFTNVYGLGASPILHDGAVYLACDQALDSFLLCVDAATGDVRWRVPRPEAKSGHCTPIVRVGADGEPELLLPGSFLLDAYDPRTGARRWAGSGLCFEMKSVPVLHDELVLVAGYGSPMNQPGNQVVVDDFTAVAAERDADGDARLSREEMPPTRAAAWFDFVDLDRDGGLDARDWGYLQKALASQNGLLAFRAPETLDAAAAELPAAELAWSYRRAVPQLPSPLVYEDVLYILADGGGLVTTLDPATGEELAKERLADAVDSYYASPVAGDGKVYLVSEHGLVSVLPAGGSLEPVWSGDLGENVYATPALAEGRIYLRTTESLYCFEGGESR